MPMRPFKRKPVEALSPEAVKARLIAAAANSRRRLRASCERYKDVVAANLALMCKAPDDIGKDPANGSLVAQASARLMGIL